LRSAPRKRVVKRGGDTWFFLTADYAFGHSLERDATQVIVQNGGKLIGSVAHPFSTPDLSSFILQAQSSKAKIIGLASGPPDNVNAIKLGGKFGIFQGGQQMAGLLVLITDVNALGLKAAQGLLLTTSFYWNTDDKTRESSKRFFAKINRMPTMWQAGVYSTVMHYLKAIEAAGTNEPLKVAAKMRDMPVDDFFAHNGRLREDELMVHELMLVQVKRPEDSKYPGIIIRSSLASPENRRLVRPIRPVRWSKDERALRGGVAQFAAVEIALRRALGRGFAGCAKSEKRKAGPDQPCRELERARGEYDCGAAEKFDDCPRLAAFGCGEPGRARDVLRLLRDRQAVESRLAAGLGLDASGILRKPN